MKVVHVVVNRLGEELEHSLYYNNNIFWSKPVVIDNNYYFSVCVLAAMNTTFQHCRIFVKMMQSVTIIIRSHWPPFLLTLLMAAYHTFEAW